MSVVEGLNFRVKQDMLVRDKVVEVLRQAIMDGVLEPGRRLTEMELVELTGVSRTSVREALRQLQAERLVEPSSGRGLRVVIPTEDEVANIYEVRAALEPLAVRLFVERASQEETDELVRAARLSNDGGAGIFLFDQLLLAGSRNPILIEVLGSLYTRLHVLRRISFSTPGRAAVSKREYENLVAAIERRSPEDAQKAATLHVKAATVAALIAVGLLNDPV